jgi:hypothetical protein
MLSEPLTLYRRHSTNASSDPRGPAEGVFVRHAAYRRKSATLRAAARYARDAGAGLEPRLAHRFRSGAEILERQSNRWELRADLVAETNILRRSRLMGQLAAGGAYQRRSSGALGLRGLARDLAAVLRPEPPVSPPDDREDGSR